MKIIIWIAVIYAGTVLNLLLGYITGIRAGALVLYFVEAWAARKLCQKWDEHIANRHQNRRSNYR